MLQEHTAKEPASAGKTAGDFTPKTSSAELAPTQSVAAPRANHLLHLQRTVGNRAVCRMAEAKAVQRDSGGLQPFPPVNNPFGFPSAKDPFAPAAHDPNEFAPSDMVEMNWTPMAAPSKGPDQPNEIAIELGPVPRAPGINLSIYKGPADCKGMNCHKPNEGGGPSFGPPKPKTWDDGGSRAMAIFQERRDDWAALGSDIAKTVGSFNRTAPLIRKYNDAAHDPALADLYGVAAKGPGDLGSKVESKVVAGKKGPGGTTVAGVFGTGTSVDMKDIEGNIQKAATGDVNSKFVSALADLKAADHDFKAESAAVSTANSAAKAAGEKAQAAHFLVEEVKAGEEKEKAEKELAEAKEKAEKVKKYIGWAIKGVTFVAGLALAPEVVIPAAVAGGGAQLNLFPEEKPAAPAEGKEGGEGKKGGLPEGFGEGATMIAEKAVDFWYAGDLAKANELIRKSTADMKTARKNYVNTMELASVDELAAAMSNVTAAMEKLKAKIIKRRDAYRAVAREAASAGGGTPQERQKMEAVIMAIPACETVVTATSNIIDSIEDVPYSRPSGVAVGMAMNSAGTAGAGAVLSFTDNLGYLRGYKGDFQVKNKLWTERLNSAKQILTKLGIESA